MHQYFKLIKRSHLEEQNQKINSKHLCRKRLKNSNFPNT